jgi:hypothetical protein
MGDTLPVFAKTMLANTLTRVHATYHRRMYRRMISRNALADLEQAVCRSVTPVTAPVALISQIERSGGTLLSQLFDGHPSVAAYPHELRLGMRNDDHWPAQLSSFEDAADLKMQKLMKRGFRKGRHGEAFRFLISPRIQKMIFDGIEKPTPRDSYNAFFTAFFNAWLDYNQDLRGKSLITAFAPRIALKADNVDRFFAVYPDGFLIQVRRDFESWSRSARPFYEGLNRPMPDGQLEQLWTENAESIDRNQTQYGDRVLIVAFQDLRNHPEATMVQLSKRLQLDYSPVLCQPTFNGRAAWANSSFDVQKPGLLDEKTT